MDYQASDRLVGEHSLDGCLRISVVSGCQVIAVAGELDLYTGPPLRRLLLALAEEDPDRTIVVDFERLTFLDSSGLGVLVGATRRLRAGGGALRLAGCRGAVAEVLVITGLHRVFALYDSVEAAVADSAADSAVGSATQQAAE